MKVPPQILSRLDIEMQEAITAGTPLAKDYLSQLKLSDKNIKDKTRDVLWSIYEREGYHTFMRVADNMRSFKDRNFNDLIQVKGEVAEVVLEVILHQFIKERKLDWHCYKGLILGNKNNPDFSTELDLVVITPHVVSIIEIKSYNGDKVLTKDCFLTAKNGGQKMEKDIFHQNKLHISTFWDNFKPHAKGSIGVIKSVLFSFSKGGLKDERSPDKIAIMPAYTEENFGRYLSAVMEINRPPSWEVGPLVSAIQKSQKNARSIDEHIAYVKSIRRS